MKVFIAELAKRYKNKKPTKVKTRPTKPKRIVSKYEEAAEVADNELLSPRCLVKAGLVYEKLGKFDDAVKAYTKIKTDYNGSPEAVSIDKYITRAQLKK